MFDRTNSRGFKCRLLLLCLATTEWALECRSVDSAGSTKNAVLAEFFQLLNETSFGAEVPLQEQLAVPNRCGWQSVTICDPKLSRHNTCTLGLGGATHFAACVSFGWRELSNLTSFVKSDVNQRHHFGGSRDQKNAEAVLLTPRPLRPVRPLAATNVTTVAQLARVLLPPRAHRTCGVLPLDRVSISIFPLGSFACRACRRVTYACQNVRSSSRPLSA